MELRKIAARALVAAVGIWLVASGCGGGGAGGREITIDEPVRLSRAFESGQSVKYMVKSDGEMVLPMKGYERVVTTQSEFKLHCAFTDVREDEIDIAVRFDRAVASISEGDHTTMQESAGALQGKTLELSLAPNGQVRSFSGMAGEAYFNEGAGQGALMFSGLFPILPDEPLPIGFTWEQDLDIPSITSSANRDFVGDVTYTVVGFKEKYGISCIEVSTVGSFEFQGRVEQQGEAWLMSGAGESTGTLLFSIEDGWILYGKSSTTLELEGEGSTTAGAGASDSFEVVMKIEDTIELL